MRGRIPKPVEQRLREGMAGHRPLPEPVVVAGRVVPEELAKPPRGLPADARWLWKELVPHLAAAGIVDRIDMPLLEMLVTQYARAVEARKILKREGLMTTGSVGQARAHPAVKLEREATLLFGRLGSQLGIGPVGRTRLGVAELHRRHLMQQEVERVLGSASSVVDGEEGLPPGLPPTGGQD